MGGSQFGLAGEALATRFGLATGDTVTIVGAFVPRIAFVRITGVFRAESVANDELLVDFSMARFLTGLGPANYHSIRVRTTDPGEMLRFLDRFQSSVHVSGPGIDPTDIHSDPPKDERLANVILRTGVGGAPRDYLATALGEATTSVRVVAYGIAILIGVLVGFGVHATQARAFADRAPAVGVLRAIGASNGWLRRRLLLESLPFAVLAGLLGAAIGFFTGIVLLRGLDLIVFGHQVPIAFDLVTSALIVLVLVGISMASAVVLLRAYLLGVKATGRRIAGLAAGLFIALFGSFLLLTSSVAKESIGLLVFPMAVLLFHERSDPRKRALAVLLLAFLPFLHSLTTFLTLGTVAALVVLTQRRAPARGRFSWKAFALDVVSGPALAVGAWAYYASVDLPFLADVLAPQALTLFVAVVVLLTALIAPLAKPAKRRLGKGLVRPASKIFLPPVLGFFLLISNSTVVLFVGTIRTPPAFFLVLPALVGFAAFAIVGLQMVRRTTNRTNDLVVAMLVAPVALILFGFLRGLDPSGLLFVYRAFDFMDYASAVLIEF